MKKQCKRNENSIISSESAAQQSRSMPEERKKKRNAPLPTRKALHFLFRRMETK